MRGEGIEERVVVVGGSGGDMEVENRVVVSFNVGSGLVSLLLEILVRVLVLLY